MATVVELRSTEVPSSTEVQAPSSQEGEQAGDGSSMGFGRPAQTVSLWQPANFGVESWAHCWMQRAHVAAAEQECDVALPCLGSAGAVQGSVSSGLLQLERFPWLVNDESLRFSSRSSKSFDINSDYNFVKNINIKKLFVGDSSTNLSGISCKGELLAASLGPKEFIPFSNVSKTNANVNNPQQMEGHFSASVLDSYAKEAFPSITNLPNAKTESKKSFAEAVVPKVVSDSIPLVGCTPECGIIMQKVVNTFLDDYARAIMDVAGPKSITFLGKAPGMSDYMMAFLVSPNLVTKVVENGVKVRGAWICVTRVQEPATKVIVSDVLPYIADSEILGACKSFAKPVFDKLRRIPAAVRGSRFSGILSFRREMQLILNREAILPETISVFSNGILHTLQLSAVGMKCYRCAAVGHVAARCKTILASMANRNDSAGKEGLVNPSNDGFKVPPFPPPLGSQVGREMSSGVSDVVLQDMAQLQIQKSGIKSLSTPPTVVKQGNSHKSVSKGKKSSSTVDSFSNPYKSECGNSKEGSGPLLPPDFPKKFRPSGGGGGDGDADIKNKKLSKNSGPAHKDGSPQTNTQVDSSVFCFKSSLSSGVDEGGFRQKKAKMSGVLCSDQPSSSAKGKKQSVFHQKNRGSELMDSEVDLSLPLQGSQVASPLPPSQGQVCGAEGGVFLDNDPSSISPSPRRRRKMALKIGVEEAQDKGTISAVNELEVTSNLELSSSNDSALEKKKFLVVKKPKVQKFNQMQCVDICQSLLDEVFGLKIAKRRIILSNYLSKYPELNLIIESGMGGMLSAQPGSQVHKTLVALCRESESIGKKYGVRSTKEH